MSSNNFANTRHSVPFVCETELLPSSVTNIISSLIKSFLLTLWATGSRWPCK